MLVLGYDIHRVCTTKKCLLEDNIEEPSPYNKNHMNAYKILHSFWDVLGHYKDDNSNFTIFKVSSVHNLSTTQSFKHIAY